MIKKYWDEFISYVTSFGLSKEELGFNPGTSLEKIEDLEQKLNFKFPADYKELLQLCNGQKLSSPSCYFNWLPTRMRLLPIDEIFEEWEYSLQFVEKEFLEEFWDVYHEEEQIRSILYHKQRIPVASIEGIADLFLDNVPGPSGVINQLITNYNECDYVVLAVNFTQLINRFLNLIEKGILKFRKIPSKYSEGYELYCPNEKYFEGNELAELFNKYS